MTGATPRRQAALRAVVAVVWCLCALAPTARPAPPVDAAPPAATEWPREWDGAPLRPLALSAVEHRFAARFPGSMARLTDGHQVFVLRTVNAPTRMLHPAADCYRGLGYRVTHVRLEADARGRRWRCFDATRDGRTTRVCERITDAAGRVHTDTSSWYWDALLGRSTGPWQAVTVASIQG